MADLPLFLFVAEDLPVKTVADLVAYARKNPDKLTYASSGNGSSAHLTGADFALQNKITMTHVAYKGSAPILTDLLGGRVSMVFDPILVPMQYVKQNRLKALAFTGKERWPTEPGIPTMEEAGLPGFVTGSWAGLMAPANTPKPIIERMAREISEIVKEPDVRQKFLDAGFLPAGGSTEQFAALMEKDSGAVCRDHQAGAHHRRTERGGRVRRARPRRNSTAIDKVLRLPRPPSRTSTTAPLC